MKILRKKRSYLKRPMVAVLFVFLPFIIFHFAWIAPVIQWYCLCPESSHQCCCNCRKCIKSRGGFKSFCYLRHHHRHHRPVQREKPITSALHKQKGSGQLETSHVSVETLRCSCNGHLKQISQHKEVLIEKAMGLGIPIPMAGLRFMDNMMPPEIVFPQPEVPG